MNPVSSEQAPIVRVVDLSFTYSSREVPTLREVCLDIQEGQFVLLTGATGSGKTTLLNCLGGIIPHLSAGTLEGRVEVDGLDTRATPLKALSRHLGIVLQNPDAQLCATRVEDEVAFGLENLNMPPRDIGPRIAWALNRVGLENQRYDEVKSLSGGQKQRLVIAAALAMGPRILLMDEPISQLDPTGARDILALLQQLRDDQGLTVAIIEHRLEEVAPLVDRVLVMEDGRCVLDEPHDRVWFHLETFRKQGLMVPSLPALFETLGRPERPLYVSVAATLLQTQPTSMPGEQTAVRDSSAGSSDPALASEDRTAPVLLEARGLTFRYRRDTPEILRGINLTFQPGERVAILGANGAGKSTLLSCLAGVFRATRGEVLFRGRRVKKPSLDIGLMFQDPDLMLLSDTVREELSFAPFHHRVESRETEVRVRDVARALHLGPLMDDAPLGLSRGQRLRVAVASALTAHPAVLLLDEPTTGQDRRHIELLMEGLAQQPSVQTLVFCTHDVANALRHGTRVIVMAEGGIIADGPPRFVLADPDVLARGEIILPPARVLGLAMGLDVYHPDELAEAIRGRSL